MSDPIKREDAIEVASRECHEFRGIFSRIKEGINRLPSADRPQGEWKPYDRTWGRETWYCTNCEKAVVDMPTCMGTPLYEYCPNCGAIMIERREE